MDLSHLGSGRGLAGRDGATLLSSEAGARGRVDKKRHIGTLTGLRTRTIGGPSRNVGS